MTTRRKFLKLIGGGTVIAAAGSTGFAVTRTPKTALAPWENASTYTEPRKRALAHALLAPNPHNRQPWLVELVGEDTVILHRDETRDLPETDPFHRQLFIGLGCFVELMVIAASADGYAVETTLFPEGDAGPVAKAVFQKGSSPDLLAVQIQHRRTCREPFVDQPLSAEVAAKLSDFAMVITDKPQVDQLHTLTWDAFKIETHTNRTMTESADLMRIGKAEINRNPDGLNMQGPVIEALYRSGLVSKDAMLDTASAGFQSFLKDYKGMLMSTPAFVVLTSPSNTRTEQVNSGRRWLRLNLKTTELGLSLHPVSQALQEYPEMADHYANAHTLLAQPGETVQMLGRLGYGPEVAKSPRWPLETRLLNG